MPRRLREASGGIVYHVLNRAAGRAVLFDKAEDYRAFLRCIDHAMERVPTRLLGFVLMPTHFHLVLWPGKDGELSEFMRLLTVTHTQRWHAHHHTTGTGPVYQGRFKSFPIQEDEHLLTVLRYVDRNPLRAGKVRRAERWEWGGLHQSLFESPPAWLVPGESWPLRRPKGWLDWVNTPQSPKEEAELAASIRRGRPFGSPKWTLRTAEEMDLLSTLRPPGRPMKTK